MKNKGLLALVLAGLLYLALGVPADPSALQFDFLLNQVRSSAGALVGGKVYFYAAGTSTPKAAYLDINKASTAANPYTLDSNATAQLYGDGSYRIVIKNASGSTIYDRDNVWMQAASDVTPAALTTTYVNVKDHGAVGNGTTDDTAAIQDAIDHAGIGNLYDTARGGSVFLPKGDYKVTSTLILRPGVHLAGESTEGVRILSYLSSGAVLEFNADSWDHTVLPRVMLENFTILAKSNNSAGDALYLHSITNEHSPVVRHVTIIGNQSSSYNLAVGLHITNANNPLVEGVYVQKLSSHGFHFTTSRALNMNTCYSALNTGDGYRISVEGGVTSNNIAYDNTGAGFYFLDAATTTSIGDMSYVNTSYGVWIENSINMTLSGTYIQGEHTTGLLIDSGNNINVFEPHIEKIGSPSGWAVYFINSPGRTHLRGGDFTPYGSGAVSDPTYWDSASGPGYFYVHDSAMIGPAPTITHQRGVLDVYGPATIGDGAQTVWTHTLELTDTPDTSLGLYRANTTTGSALTIYGTAPSSNTWVTGLIDNSVDFMIRDEAHNKIKVRLAPSLSTSGDNLVMDSDGNVYLSNHGSKVKLPETNGVEISGPWLTLKSDHISIENTVAVNQSTAPTLNSCGGGTPSVAAGSSDFAGKVAMGVSATSCTLVFHTTCSIASSCVITGYDITITDYTSSASGFTVNTSASGTFSYMCVCLDQ